MNNTYINKNLIITILGCILVLFQSRDGSIFIDASLVLISFYLAKSFHKNEKKFDFYAWSAMFIVFISIFILKAFILV